MDLLILIMNSIQEIKSCIKATDLNHTWTLFETRDHPSSLPSLDECTNLLYLCFFLPNTNPIWFCFTGNYDAVMQQSAWNNQLCNLTPVKCQYLEQHCPPQVNRGTAQRRVWCQSFVASHSSSPSLSSATTQLLPGINLGEVREGK